MALWISRTLPERLTGLIPIPTMTSSFSGAPTLFQNSDALGSRAEANLVELLRKFFRHKIENLLRVRRAGGELDPRVNVFRVFAEDHHVDLLGMLHG